MQVIAHGLKWILNGQIARCPDCDSKRMSEHKLMTEKNDPNYAEAEFQCKDCECIFRIVRDEREEKIPVVKEPKAQEGR